MKEDTEFPANKLKENIVQFREVRNIKTQVEMAEQIGYPLRKLRRIEQGCNVDITDVVKLAICMGLSLQDLVFNLNGGHTRQTKCLSGNVYANNLYQNFLRLKKINNDEFQKRKKKLFTTKGMIMSANDVLTSAGLNAAFFNNLAKVNTMRLKSLMWIQASLSKYELIKQEDLSLDRLIRS